MAEQENVRIIQRAYESFQRHDLLAVLNALTDDVEWVTPGPVDILPLAGHRRGRDEVMQFFSLFNGGEEVEQFEPQEYVAQGDKVVVFLKYRSRIKATGGIAEVDLVQVFTLRDGKIAAFYEYYGGPNCASVPQLYRQSTVAAKP
jgi:ketosteroid isomerase-like protein